jgi:uncharacterized protein
MNFPSFFAAALLVLACLAAAHAQTASPTPATPACPPRAQAPTPEEREAAAAQARDRGLLWRIRKDGQVSYLYGTIHVGRLPWMFAGNKVRAALAATDTLAVEIDVLDPALRDSKGRLPEGIPSPRLPRALAARIATQRDRACLPAGLLEPLHPVLQAVMLHMVDARWIGLDPAFGQEVALITQARQQQRPVVQLETPELQMRALLPRSEREALEVVNGMLRDLETGQARRVMSRLATAWEQGRYEELASYEQWCDCVLTERERDFYRRVNDGRNPQMAERIAELHARGKRVFVAVGALHMTGDQALPKLMAARGFEVERIVFE